MKILDTEIPLQRNLMDSFKVYLIFWIFLVLSEITDSLSTIIFMNKGGVELEANLLIRWLDNHLGITLGIFIGKFLQFFSACCFSALSLKLSRAILLLFIALNLLATIHNISY